MKTYTLAFAMLFAAGCGSGDNNNGSPDLSTAGGHDLSVSADLSTVQHDLATAGPDFSGISCGTNTCTGGQLCCATQVGQTLSYECATSCADGGSITLACDDPSQCNSGQFCCGTVMLGAGTPPNCSIMGSSMCTGTCNSSLPTGCPDTGTVKLCHHAADCASDTQNPNCCEFSFNGNNISFCASALYKTFATQCFN